MALVNKFKKKSFKSEFTFNSVIYYQQHSSNDGYFYTMKTRFEDTQYCTNVNNTDILQKVLHCDHKNDQQTV